MVFIGSWLCVGGIETDIEERMAGTQLRRKGLSKRLQTRRKIALAAQEEYSEVGYQTSTVERIAARAGVSRATFYTHFSSKVEAFTELWSVHIDDDLIALLDGLNEVAREPDRGALRLWLDHALTVWEKHGDLLELTTKIVALEPSTTEPWMKQNVRAVDTVTHYLVRFSPDELPVARVRLGMLLLQLDRMVFLMHRGVLPSGREVLLDALLEEWWPCISLTGTGGTETRSETRKS